MADEKKKFSLGGIDSAAEEKGSGMKALWQFVKFIVVSGLVTIIQLVLANVLPYVFDSVHATIPHFLQGIFAPNTIFDASVFSVPIDQWINATNTALQKVVSVAAPDGIQALKDNWDSVKDIIGVAEFKEFKTQLNTFVDINKYVSGYAIENGAIVKGVITWGYLLPFFLSNLIANIYGFYQNKKTTFKSDAPWYNFAIYIFLMIALILFSTWFQGWLYGVLSQISFLAPLARTIGGLAAGFVQMIVLFPMEKFVLLKEKKPAEGEEAAAEAE